MEIDQQTILKEYAAATKLGKHFSDTLVLACETLSSPSLYHVTLKLFYILKEITERLERHQRPEFIENMHIKMEDYVRKVGRIN